MKPKVDAELDIRALVGGSVPREGDTLVRGRSTWTFSRFHYRGVSAGDPTNLQSGDFWLDSGTKKLTFRLDNDFYEVTLTLRP